MMCLHGFQEYCDLPGLDFELYLIAKFVWSLTEQAREVIFGQGSRRLTRETLSLATDFLQNTHQIQTWQTSFSIYNNHTLYYLYK
jgi:hypothetical protein